MAAASQLQAHGVTVNCICPGGVITARGLSYQSSEEKEEYLEEQRRLRAAGSLARQATVDEVARVACFFAGSMGAFVTGSVLKVEVVVAPPEAVVCKNTSAALCGVLPGHPRSSSL